MQIREMTIADYDAVLQLLKDTAGVRLREADSRPLVSNYLDRNPGLSFVAVDGAAVIGRVMCGHDGRRGYLQHLAVCPAYRLRGIGASLVSRCLAALACLGILKTHIDVLASNEAAMDFWLTNGWIKRDDIVCFSYVSGGDPNA